MEQKKTFTKHLTPGEHTHEGITYNFGFPAKQLDKIKTFEFDDSDIIVDTYPKCGTTWMQAIVDRVFHKNNQEEVTSDTLDNKFPFIELVIPDGPSFLDVAASRRPPRLMKSHLYAHFFENTLKTKNTKFIIVLRNPRDALVSFYHFYTATFTFGPYKGTWDEFFEDMVKGDHLVHGNIFDHVAGWWKYKDHPNVIFFKYEDMKKNIHAEIKRVADFLNINLTPDIINAIAKDTSFDEMKDNTLLNKAEIVTENKWDMSKPGFVRKGQVGDWINHFSEEQLAYIDAKTDHYFKNSGLSFEYESS